MGYNSFEQPCVCSSNVCLVFSNTAVTQFCHMIWIESQTARSKILTLSTLVPIEIDYIPSFVVQ